MSNSTFEHDPFKESFDKIIAVDSYKTAVSGGSGERYQTSYAETLDEATREAINNGTITPAEALEAQAAREGYEHLNIRHPAHLDRQ